MSEYSTLQIDLDNRELVRQFQILPFHIYRDIPQWVPPISLDSKRMLDRRNPYFQHSEAAFFLLLNPKKEAIGRLAMLDNRNYNTFNQSRTAFFFLFECVNDVQAGQELFTSGFEWARARGLSEIVGPRGFTALDGLGLLAKGFAHRPAFGIPYNPDYYVELVEQAGFRASGELLSGYISSQGFHLPEKIEQIAELVKQRRGLQVATFKTRRDLRRIIPNLKNLYNASLGGTSGNVPLTDAEVQAIAGQMLWFADPRLIKIIMKDDDPVGFLFAYPDISIAVQRTGGRVYPLGWVDMLIELRQTKWININGAGIIDQYRGLGGTALLFSELYKTVVESRFKHADIVQIGTENDRMLRELRDIGIDFYKTHRLYRMDL